MMMAMMISVLGSLLGMGLGMGMPDSELVSVEYTVTGTMAGYQYYALVERQQDGVVMVKAMRKNYGELVEKRVDGKVLDDLRDIIKEHKMYAYKEHYRPRMQVLDGYMWSFHAAFADGKCISSGGSNAGPSDDGLETIREYVIALLGDGESKNAER